MAALGFRPEDMAAALGLSYSQRDRFLMEAFIPGTEIFRLIKEGTVQVRAIPEIKLHEAAEAGNLDAIKQLEEVKKKHHFENLVEDMDAYE